MRLLSEFDTKTNQWYFISLSLSVFANESIFYIQSPPSQHSKGLWIISLSKVENPASDPCLTWENIWHLPGPYYIIETKKVATLIPIINLEASMNPSEVLKSGCCLRSHATENWPTCLLFHLILLPHSACHDFKPQHLWILGNPDICTARKA